MQYKSSKSFSKTASNATPTKNLGIFEAIIRKYSQETTALDPNAIQQGQSIYDSTGEEYVIIEDDPTTTDKVLMPATQEGQQIPEGVKTVQDTELSTEYSVQNPSSGVTGPTTASLAKEFKRY